MRSAAEPVRVVANNGDVAGGEEMALRVAEALRDLGREVVAVGPRSPGEFVGRAGAAGLPVETIAADDRRRYLTGLATASRRWRGLVWAHGLLAGLGTAGLSRRVLHLHQQPAPRHRALARAAQLRAALVLAPSRHTAAATGALALANWTGPQQVRHRSPREGPSRVGFLGRRSQDKGLDVLARAVALLDDRHPGSIRLLVAGDDRHVPAEQRAAVRAALAPLGPLVEEWGWVPRERLFDAVDVVVVPSVWPEPFGLVAAEAMGSGVPVVVTDAGGLPEVVGPEHPWVARHGDAEHLAAVLTDALSPSSPGATAAARRRWEQCYSPAAGAARVADILSLVEADERG